MHLVTYQKVMLAIATLPCVNIRGLVPPLNHFNIRLLRWRVDVVTIPNSYQ